MENNPIETRANKIGKTIRLSQKGLLMLDFLTRREGRSESFVIEAALEDYFRRHLKEYSILQGEDIKIPPDLSIALEEDSRE